MLVAFDDGAGGAGSYWFCDQSYDYSYDWSDGGRWSGVGPAPMSDAEKLEILAEAFRPGVRVCDVIARLEVSSSLIYTRRKELQEGGLAGVVPSLPVFAEVEVAEAAVPAPQPAPCMLGFIDIELPSGMRVSVDAGVDAASLARVLSLLR